jgi:exopolysaccharide biosynthesis protein
VRQTPRIVLVPVVLAALIAVPGAGAAPMPIHLGTTHGRVVLADGVTTWRQTIHVHTGTKWHKVRVVLLRAHPGTGGARIGAGSPGSLVGQTRTPVNAQADATDALAGINADLFSFDTAAAVPHGALIMNGNVLKTPPNTDWNANFYIRADGTAAIGPLPFTGSLTRKPRTHGDPAQTRGIASINTLADAALGRITLVTHSMVTTPIAKNCTVAQGATVGGQKTISSVSKGHLKLRRPALAHWALVACGGSGGKWLAKNVQAGDRVKTAVTFTNGTPLAAVSGTRVLRADGHSFDDVNGEASLNWANPETFACVSKTGASVLFGVLDGRSAVSYGVTYDQLAHYMNALHCWSGMVFDGGGSSTMVARLPGGTQTTVLNVPSDGRPREVADGLYVYPS